MQAVARLVGSGLPGRASGPQTRRSARAPARVMYRLVVDQSRPRGCSSLSLRSIQNSVWSAMSFLITVLSQSKTASGRGAPAGAEHVPRASIVAWIRAALPGYQSAASPSCGQRAGSGPWARAPGAGHRTSAARARIAMTRRRDVRCDAVIPPASPLGPGRERAPRAVKLRA